MPTASLQHAAPKSSTASAWIFKQRGILAHLPLFFAVFWTRGQTRSAALAWGLGLALVLLGTAVRVWAQSHIHHRWQVPMLFTASGPYRLMRNPLYIGNTLIILGATACSRLLWLVPVALLWCALVYSLVVRHEERDLLDRFDEPYRRYLAEVPRWFPGALGPLELSSRHIPRAVLRELQCLLIVLPFAGREFVLHSAAGQALWQSVLARL